MKRKVGGNGRENENFKKASLKAQFYIILGERGWREELVQMLLKEVKKKLFGHLFSRFYE